MAVCWGVVNKVPAGTGRHLARSRGAGIHGYRGAGTASAASFSLFSLLLFLFSWIILLPARPDSKVLDPHDWGSASVTNRIRTPEAPTDFPCYLWLLTFKVFLFFFPVFLFPKDRKQSWPQPADIYLLKALGQQITAQI